MMCAGLPAMALSIPKPEPPPLIANVVRLPDGALLTSVMLLFVVQTFPPGIPKLK
jgi:hypothetical protein